MKCSICDKDLDSGSVVTHGKSGQVLHASCYDAKVAFGGNIQLEFPAECWTYGGETETKIRSLAQWKSRLKLGVKLRCTYRFFAPRADEIICIKNAQTNAVAWDYENRSGAVPLMPGTLAWMVFPKKDGIRFTIDGFELLRPDGSRMARYHWIPETTAAKLAPNDVP